MSLSLFFFLFAFEVEFHVAQAGEDNFELIFGHYISPKCSGCRYVCTTMPEFI